MNTLAKCGAVLCLLLATPNIPHAEEFSGNVNQLITSDLKKEISNFLKNDVVINSIQDQNKRNANLSLEQIEDLDKLWRKQRKEEDQYLIAAVLSNPLSAYLTRLQAHSAGKFVEIFVMDDKGLNVGQSSISSDYWQGDEAKWQKTYKKGSGTVFIDDPEYNSEFKQWRVQYNTAVSDHNNNVIGAATIELNLTELMRRKGETN